MQEYYVYVSEETTLGPHDVDGLQEMVAANSLSGEDYLWADGSADWVTAETLLPQLFGGKAVPAGRRKQSVIFPSITDNPFRILGISVDASERDKTKALRKAMAFTKARKAVSFDTDFDLSAKPPRTNDDLEDAQSKIQQVDGRLRHAHMWFWEGNPLDKKAFQNFRNGQSKDGAELLERNVRNKGVSKNNYSSVRNLGLYYLDRSTAGGSLNARLLTAGIKYLGRFCRSEQFDEYSSISGDKRLQVPSNKLQEQIVDDIYRPLKGAIDSGGIEIKTLLNAFDTFPELTKKYLKDKFTSSPVSDIESFVTEAERRTKQAPTDGYKAARQLYQSSKPRMALLGNILDADDFQLEALKSDIADTMQQCAIKYHNELLDNDEDPGVECLELVKMAYEVCDTGTIGEKLRKDQKHFEEWNKNKAAREKQKSVSVEIERLGELIDGAKDTEGYGALAEAKTLISQGQARLNRIKVVLGARDEEYLQMSDFVALLATSLLIKYANVTSDCLGALPLMEKIGKMDMSNKTMTHWSSNIRILRGNVSQSSYAPRSGGSGCVVAIIALIVLWVLAS
jgi:hypothetical protein